MFPDQHGETIKLLGEPRYSDYGQLLGREILGTIEHCVIGPAGDSEVLDDGYFTADVNRLQVFAPPGTVIEDRARVDIRGRVYIVQARGFDYSPGRRPVVARHRPKVVFTAVAAEVSDDGEA